MEQIEIEYSTEQRGKPSKISCKELSKIYYKYTGINFNTCFCSQIERIKFYKLYYAWFDEQKENY